MSTSPLVRPMTDPPDIIRIGGSTYRVTDGVCELVSEGDEWSWTPAESVPEPAQHDVWCVVFAIQWEELTAGGIVGEA